MEKIEKGSNSNFFTEIIIVILFFAIAATIIVRIFAISVSNNEINNIRSKVVINAGSIIDVYKSGYSLAETIEEVIGCNYDKDIKKCRISLDNDMMQSSKGNIILNLEESVKTNRAGNCKSIRVSYVYRNKEIYVIEGKKYEEK